MGSPAATEALRRRGLRLACSSSSAGTWSRASSRFAAGLAAGSIALVGFGIDSSIEVFAAAVVVWQLRGAHGRGRAGRCG